MSNSELLPIPLAVPKVSADAPSATTDDTKPIRDGWSEASWHRDNTVLTPLEKSLRRHSVCTDEGWVLTEVGPGKAPYAERCSFHPWPNNGDYKAGRVSRKIPLYRGP